MSVTVLPLIDADHIGDTGLISVLPVRSLITLGLLKRVSSRRYVAGCRGTGTRHPQDSAVTSERSDLTTAAGQVLVAGVAETVLP